MNFLNDGRHSPAFLGEKATEGIDKEEGKAMREKETEAEGDESKASKNYHDKPWAQTLGSNLDLTLYQQTETMQSLTLWPDQSS